ncbi:hypothetical protein J3E69DRAFT_322542, partial [Trichoderma sp. SZMC 28015]
MAMPMATALTIPPSLSILCARVHVLACLHRYCTADITPAGMWPSHKQDLSPAADRLGVCVSLFPSSPCPSVARPACACEGTRTPPIISPLLGNDSNPRQSFACSSTSTFGSCSCLLDPRRHDVLLLFCGEASPSPRLGGKKETINCPIVPRYV